MFDSLIEDYWRGYTHEQYARALYETLVNYLAASAIIDIDEYRKYEEEYFETILKEIVKKDKEAKENGRK